MTRGAFLKRVAAVTAVALAPAALDAKTAHAVPAPPRFYGDGIHDDTAAIQALFDEGARRGIPVFLPAGTYRVSTIHIRGEIHLGRSEFRSQSPGPMLVFDRSASGSSVSNVTLHQRHPTPLRLAV